MTRDQIRTYLDRLNISTGVDDDGDLRLVLEKDEDFGYDVVVWVLVTENRISFVGAATNYKPDGDLYFLVNRSNGRRNFPTAVVRGDEVRMEYSFLITEEVSDEYMKNIIRSTVASMWSAFRDLEKDDKDI